MSSSVKRMLIWGGLAVLALGSVAAYLVMDASRMPDTPVVDGRNSQIPTDPRLKDFITPYKGVKEGAVPVTTD